jgi:pimeloyl-ACP methyl ester carboxylesterase
MAKPTPVAADFIGPLNMNGLQGRMLHMPAPKGKTKEILFIYGHHSSLERWFGVAQNLNKDAAITMPDLPGFGGMDSFYKIGQKATIDNFADYLAAFVKMRYKRKKVIIVGMSLGFVMATRMLQRYPDLAKRVELLMSYVGFSHYDDFSFTRGRRLSYLWGARFFSLPLASAFFRYVCLHPFILKTVYKHTHNAKEKFKAAVSSELEEITRTEIGLWHGNDVRTYMRTTAEFLTLDNCKQQVNLPVYHVAMKGDRYFNNAVVEQHLRIIYSDFKLLALLKVGNHAPSIIADAKSAAPFIPPKLHRMLNKL